MLQYHNAVFFAQGISAIVLCALMGLSPVASLVYARRKRIPLSPSCKAFVPLYILAILFCVFGIVFPLSVSTIKLQTLFYFCQRLLPLLALAGPAIAIEVYIILNFTYVDHCTGCGYDLTGNTSGICSECGIQQNPDPENYQVSKKSFSTKSYRRFAAPYAACTILLACILGYNWDLESHICSECNVTRSQPLNKFNIPFTNITLVTWSGKPDPVLAYSDPITPILDPDGNCEHNWIKVGGIQYHIINGSRVYGPFRPLPWVTEKPDFPDFAKANPEVLKRIRKDLRQKQYIGEWLDKDYYEWKEQATR